jgi:hypothetical protein
MGLSHNAFVEMSKTAKSHLGSWDQSQRMVRSAFDACQGWQLGSA